MKSKYILAGCLLMTFILSACGKDEAIMSKNEEQMGAVSTEGEASVIGNGKEENGLDRTASEDGRTDADASREGTLEMATPEEKDTEAVVEGEHYIDEIFTSAALASAKDGSSPTKRLKVYLPPNYYTSGKRYPVVYFFHGFGDGMSFIAGRKHHFNQLMIREGFQEFIVVEVDGSRANSSQGSFWMNSPVTGMWEDYVIDEIVPYIDQTYHTIPRAESRGIAGYSMGGYASLNLAMRHPHVFSSVLSLCPGVLKKGSLQLAMDSWRGDKTFLTCYGQTFAPNEAKENMCDIPAMDGTPEDMEIAAKWEDGFGNWEEKLDAYLTKDKPLKAIHVIKGTLDYYKWIPEGCDDLSRLMAEKGIDYYTMTELAIGHTFPTGYEKDYFIPFFSEHLVFEE